MSRSKAVHAATALLATLLLASACTGGPTTISHPTGTDELVLRIETGGGLVGPGFLLDAIPDFSVYGDGRVIVLGPQIAIFPGPALPNLVTVRLSEAGLQALLANAQAAGLLGADAHYDYPFIADAPTTTFTTVAEGRRHVISAYALSEGEGDPGGPGLDPGTRAARAALAAFRARALDLRSWLADGIVEAESSFEFASLRVFVTPATQPPDPSSVEPRVADWPLETPLATFGDPMGNPSDMRCGVVTGADLAALLPALQASNELTRWRSGGAEYQLILRPLLPDESGCPTST